MAFISGRAERGLEYAVSEYATMHQLADLTGSLSRITGGWAGNGNGDAVLSTIGLPSLQKYIDRVHTIIADLERLSENDGA
jgi:hypothetical protein